MLTISFGVAAAAHKVRFWAVECADGAMSQPIYRLLVRCGPKRSQWVAGGRSGKGQLGQHTGCYFEAPSAEVGPAPRSPTCRCPPPQLPALARPAQRAAPQ